MVRKEERLICSLVVHIPPQLDRVLQVRVDGPPLAVTVLQQLAATDAIAVVGVHPTISASLLPGRALQFSRSVAVRLKGQAGVTTYRERRDADGNVALGLVLLDNAEAVGIPILLTVVSLRRTVSDTFRERGKIDHAPDSWVPGSPLGGVECCDISTRDKREDLPAFDLGIGPMTEEDHSDQKGEERFHCGWLWEME